MTEEQAMVSIDGAPHTVEADGSASSRRGRTGYCFRLKPTDRSDPVGLEAWLWISLDGKKRRGKRADLRAHLVDDLSTWSRATGSEYAWKSRNHFRVDVADDGSRRATLCSIESPDGD